MSSRNNTYDATTTGPGLNTALIVVVVLALGTVLRLWGIGTGLPYVFHPDENRQVLDALGMAERGSILPEDLSYPALHKYMILVSNSVYFAVGRLLGWFTGPVDFALKFLEGRSSVFLLSRLLSAAAGVSLGLVVFKAASRLYSRSAGLIALVYSIFMFQLVQHSQWAIADIFVALFTTAALYFIALSATRPGSARYTTLALFLTGITISTKPQGLFLLLPLLISQVYAFRGAGLSAGKFSRRLIPGILVFIAAALLGNLSWVFSFEASYEKFRMLSQVAHLGISSEPPFEAGLIPLAGWFATDIIRQEGPLGLLCLAGLIYGLIRRKKEDLIFLSYTAVYLFALRDWGIRYLHLFLPLMPMLCIMAARLTAELFSACRLRKPIAVAFVLMIVLPSAGDSMQAAVVKSRVDTRLLARQWVEENIPEGTLIAMDWYEFAVPLVSPTPVNLVNPKAKDYFEKKLPEMVKAGYEEFLKEQRSYEILPIVYSTDSPNWPEEMDDRSRALASGKEVYRELYSVFNFRSVEELKRLGAEYLVISSYGYTNFLLDSDPEKTAEGVFNYLFKEDLLSFNKQSDAYIDDGRFGLLYYLNKRARDFYTPLLTNTSGARFVKEFRPRANPGPIIKIYHL